MVCSKMGDWRGGGLTHLAISMPYLGPLPGPLARGRPSVILLGRKLTWIRKNPVMVFRLDTLAEGLSGGIAEAVAGWWGKYA